MRRFWVLLLVLAGCDRLFQLGYIERDAPGGPDQSIDAQEPGPDCARAIGAGRQYTCLIDRLGDVWCWGSNEHDVIGPSAPYIVPMPTPISLQGPAKHLYTGRENVCATLEDDTTWCWGTNQNGVLGSGTPDQSAPRQLVLDGSPILEVGVGGNHACARVSSDQSVWCWGHNKFFATGLGTASTIYPPTKVPNTAGTKQLAVGHRFTCVLGADSRVSCWGRNNSGQLGAGPGADAVQPATLQLANVKSVSASGKYACLVDSNDVMRCWGDNDDGQLATGTFSDANFPTITKVDRAVQLATAGFGGCARLDDGTAECWGYSDSGNGQLDVGPDPRPASLINIKSLSGGYYHHCALANGYPVCWGALDERGELGRGARGVYMSPIAITGLAPTQLASGELHICAVANDEVYCWGENGQGQVGDGTRNHRRSPTLVATGLTGITGIAAGYMKTCAWTPTAVRCWGENYNDELSNGTNTRETLVPTAMSNVSAPLQVAFGFNHSCVLEATGVRCFGTNNYGQLSSAGSGQQVPNVTGATKIAAGGQHSCAINSGVLYCWGLNTYGQVSGDGMTTVPQQSTPTAVIAAGNAIDVGAGEEHTCVLRNDNKVLCWGRNFNGELGDGTATSRAAVGNPIVFPEGADAVAISINKRGGCALLTTNKVACWGQGDNGDNGQGAANDARSPVLVSNISYTGGPRVFTRADNGGCTFLDGTLRCWGSQRIVPNGDVSSSIPMPVMLDVCRQ